MKIPPASTYSAVARVELISKTDCDNIIVCTEGLSLVRCRRNSIHDDSLSLSQFYTSGYEVTELPAAA